MDVAALRVLQAGCIAVVIAVSTYKVFELDRFFVPKELTLHLTAFLAGLLILRSFKRSFFSRIDFMLLLFLALSALSALFATNQWLSLRALSLSASGIALFWIARGLRAAGLARPLLLTISVAVVLVAITALLQTYGLRTDLFSLNRAPGGTLGNRNFVAHVTALGLPLVLASALGARTRREYVLGAIGIALVVAVLVLTRSRAGWLAFAGGVFAFLVAMVLARPLRTNARAWLRLLGVILFCGAAVGLTVFAPNSLKWNAEHPYLQSMKRVTNFQEGSGRGRLIQYRRSLRMALDHVLLGAGPGNWAVDYPNHAAPRDPSLNRSEPGTTANPWPSSDWVAFLSERGFITAALLLAALFGIGVQGLRQALRAAELEQALGAAALVGVLLATVIAGAFDAVLLLALPTLLFWPTLGALWVPQSEELRPARASALLLLAFIAGAGAARSTLQLTAMGIYAGNWNTRALVHAAHLDPGNYDVHMRIARSGAKRSVRCEHARAAHALYPNAVAARSANARCQ